MNNKSLNYGRYHIEEELGKGSMGVVYKAHDPQIDRIVALKVLRPDKMSSEGFVQRFLREAKAIGRLSHSNIVTVYDVGRDHDTIYIAMEYLIGSSLNELMTNQKLDAATIVDLGAQVAEALDYAHQKGIIHRDIKPTNIIVTPNGQVKITDFGIARIEDPLNQQQTKIGEVLGTPAYMSPEQIKGQSIDNRADLFSLGIILYELSTGNRPFIGDSIPSIFRSILEESPAEPKAINPALPKSLSDIIIKSLHKKPDERFQTGKEMANSLRSSLNETKPFSTESFQKKDSKRLNIYITTAAFIILMLAAVIYFKKAERPSQTSPLMTEIRTPVRQMNGPVALNIETEPPGAQIYLNNMFSGKTPITLNLPMGKYEVRLSMPGYYDWEALLNLDKEGDTPLFAQLLSTNAKDP
jgi:serine/threonine protein kinase